MTGGVELRFQAQTIDEAMIKATEQWRTLCSDPEVALPWSTHFEFYEETPLETKDGRVVNGATVMMVKVRIEFDRKTVDAAPTVV